VLILNEIIAWMKDPDSQQICWITGMAGTGKTSIAKTICERATTDAEIILGGSFFCSRTGIAAQRDIRCVVPTLAQLLARQSIEFIRALVDEMARDRDVQHKHVTVQVNQLLYTPLLALKDSPRYIVFVIDALDECGSGASVLDEEGHESVSELLEALVTSSPTSVELPVKFLVTSRPETHIRDTPVSDAELSQILRLHAVNKEEVDSDIHRYITKTLDDKLSRKPAVRSQFTETDVKALVQLCDGLFIVAATVLKHTFGSGIDVAPAVFKGLLNDSRDGLDAEAAAPLDRIYESILRNATRQNEPNTTKLSALQRLLGAILSARMTLSIAALAELLAQEPYVVRAGLSRLHAVVDVPDGDHVPGLRTVHASFGDYLFNRAPNHIRISRSLGHETLALGCLDVMGKLLHFHISQNKSSYDPNPPAQPDFIALSLQYACLQWVYHVAALVDTVNLAATIGAIFRPKLLPWLEVMSLLRQVWRAAKCFSLQLAR